MFLSSYIYIAFQSRSVHFSPVWSISLYLVCFLFILVYWLKHIFRSITSEAAIKSIIAIFFFFADYILKNFDSTWNHNAPLFHIWSFFFPINITLNMKMRNPSWYYFPMPLFFIVKRLKTLKKEKKRNLLVNVRESLANQCILSNIDISLFSIQVDEPKPLLISF